LGKGAWSANLHGVRSLFHRRSPTEATDEEPPAEPAGTATATRPRSKGYTPSKKELGKTTPKRKPTGRVVEPPPANRREAARRLRAKQRAARTEARAGMLAGKEEYLLPRDKGPQRALVRNVVDARRNLATYFLPVTLVIFILSTTRAPVLILAANLLFYVLGLAVVADSVLLARRVRKVHQERFPGMEIRRGTSMYAIMRSLSFRKMRMPAPQVKLGERI
jgi:hypothetical protein